jgi:hypothetical protein
MNFQTRPLTDSGAALNKPAVAPAKSALVPKPCPRTTACSTTLLLLAGWFVSGFATAAPLSDPAVDAYNCRVSTILIGPRYHLTANTSLLEGAMVLTNLGINSYKFTLSAGSYGITPSSTITNLMLEARNEPSYRAVFDMPTMNSYVAWCYTFSGSSTCNSWNSSQANKEYNEIYALSQYFLTNYNNSGKSLYLGMWEGDWEILPNYNANTNPTPATIANMIAWMNTRQKAVDDALANTPHTNVNVFNYTEVNRVVDANTNPTNSNQRMINYVVPYVTNLDYVSWSSYDIQSMSASNITWYLNYAQSFIPTNKFAKISGKRLFVGEFGWGGSLTGDQQAPLIQAYDQTLFAWGCPFSFYWELYDNETNTDGTLRNYDLIESSGYKTQSYSLYSYFWNAAKLQVLAFKQRNGRLPTATEFNAIAASLLSSTLTPPVNLTLTAGPPSQNSSTSATLNGTLTQGVYGDSFANVTVYWGPSDGGTNRSAWADGLALGVNTNAGTVNYAPLVTNLPPGGYCYRYYATNASGEAWSAAENVQTLLNPQNYGSRMQVAFTAYNQSGTLVDFPVLVRLSTNLPGFSYAQLGSPTGGDLRCTDASGLVLIPHEIDEWNTNGTSYVWVQIPALSSPNDSIWAYWGNAAATNPPAWTTNGAVWSNGYNLAWHLKEGGFPYADSAQQYPATTGIAPTSTTGEVGKGVSFNGSSQYLTPGTINLSNAFTLSAWVNLTNTASNIQTVWANKAGGSSNGFALYVNNYNSSDRSLVFESANGTTLTKAYTSSNAVSFGQWHWVSAVVDCGAGTANLYVDGVNRTANSSLQSGFSTQLPVNLSRFATNSGTAFSFNGLMDEARIESVARPASWVWATWMTSASNSTLASCSSVTRSQPLLSLVTTITTGGAALVFNWPSSVGFALYTTTNLAPPAVWSLVTNQASLATSNIAAQWQVTLPPGSSPAGYYRLQAQ